MRRRSGSGTFRSCFAATAARSSSSETATGRISTRPSARRLRFVRFASARTAEAIDTETNRKPISAALALVLALKNAWYDDGIVAGAQFDASTLVL